MTQKKTVWGFQNGRKQPTLDEKSSESNKLEHLLMQWNSMLKSINN